MVVKYIVGLSRDVKVRAKTSLTASLLTATPTT